MSKVKVLFLAANPPGKDPLRVEREFIKIQGIIQRTPNKDLLELVYEEEVKPGELSSLLIKHHPDIVHFSGHGSSDGIVLLDAQGKAVPVERKTLTSLFKELAENIKVVFLNACYTDQQAKEIAKVVGCAIGATKEITDTTAITFATSFYEMIASGYSIQKAFNVSKINLQLDGCEKETQLLRLEAGNKTDLDNIYMVGQLYHGHRLLLYPDLWKNFVIIVNFTKQIQHVFLTLHIRHLYDFIEKINKILNTHDFFTVQNFTGSWDSYETEYHEYSQELKTKFIYSKEYVIEAFNKLQAEEEQKLKQLLSDSIKEYYEVIEEDIFEYSAIHGEIADIIRVSKGDLINALRNENTANQIASKFINLERKAKSLIVKSDNLLRKLIEAL
jgi:hypothetical protein